MSKLTYLEKATKLSMAIDIAINSIKSFPPKEWNDNDISALINYYSSLKDEVLYPKPVYRNLKSLRYSEIDALTYFQEGYGQAVDDFWRQVDEKNLGYMRENRMAKILKRKRIKFNYEYDFIIDVFLVYKQEGKLADSEVEALNRMIVAYETIHAKDIM
jgi:hypothetical protein